MSQLASAPVMAPARWAGVGLAAAGRVGPSVRIAILRLLRSCYDAEQVFLRASGGSWTVLTSGTGISCQDADSTPDLPLACSALGLRPAAVGSAELTSGAVDAGPLSRSS
jgi:hypothetical protein